MAFATAEDFATRFGRELSAVEAGTVQYLLDLATGIIQRETGQTISRVADDELTLRGPLPERLRLPQRPIEEVASVTVAGEAVDAGNWYLEGDELVSAYLPGYAPDPWWWSSPQEVVVTYTHGWDPVPAEVAAVTLEMVSRVFANPAAVASESVGGASATHAAQGLLLTDQERDALMRIVGRSVGTVTLR